MNKCMSTHLKLRLTDIFLEKYNLLKVIFKNTESLHTPLLT